MNVRYLGQKLEFKDFLSNQIKIRQTIYDIL